MPLMTAWAAKLTPWRLEPHWRLTEVPVTVTGKPAIRAAVRAMFMPCSPVCVTQPMITSSTWAGSTLARSSSAAIHMAARSSGLVALRVPRRFPIAVRPASRIYASVMLAASLWVVV
jgi:hypothetical protein